jgi:hypothetical protein
MKKVEISGYIIEIAQHGDKWAAQVFEADKDEKTPLKTIGGLSEEVVETKARLFVESRVE